MALSCSHTVETFLLAFKKQATIMWTVYGESHMHGNRGWLFKDLIPTTLMN